MTDEEIINSIASRISDEHKKHPDLDWVKIAAGKIHAQWIREKAMGDKDGWISVKDRIPDQGQCILVWVENAKKALPAEFKNGSYCDDRRCFDGERIYVFSYLNISYWQPLPPPPNNKPKV